MTPAGTFRMLLVFQSTGRVAYISVYAVEYWFHFIVAYTVDAGYKNTVLSREECSYNRYVLITGIHCIICR